MIRQTLTSPHTFDELYKKLVHSHTKESLRIELDFLVSIGKIILEKDLYRLS